MSEMRDKIRAWDENHYKLICCYRAPLDRANAQCELCGIGIAALRESRMKARGKGWHLICRECVNEVHQHSVTTKFGGRFKTSDEAQKILPQ